MSKIEDAIAILESLKRTEHEVNDDPYRSCPKTEDCTNIEHDGIPIPERPCECGMDELNEGLESAIVILLSNAGKYEVCGLGHLFYYLSNSHRSCIPCIISVGTP